MKPFTIPTAALLLGTAAIMTPAIFPGFATSQAMAQEASERTATFAIENMTCALCPITVKKAMEGVSGVKAVTVDFDAKTATVVFDPAIATLDAIAETSTNAGYPATVNG